MSYTLRDFLYIEVVMCDTAIKSNLKCPHAFSTRLGGVSSGEFESLNLGFEYGDLPDNVSKNWEIFLKSQNIPSKNIAWAKQVHGNEVCIVDENAAVAPGMVTAVGKYDGLVTNKKNICLVIFTADCAPVLLYDDANEVIAAIHCGWKPLTQDILKVGIDKMISLGANIKNIHAAIGPCIQHCCFETGVDVYKAAYKLIGDKVNICSQLSNIQKSKFLINLSKIAKIRLEQLGVLSENIFCVNACTSCSNDNFFSYRADNGKTGRMANIICLPN